MFVYVVLYLNLPGVQMQTRVQFTLICRKLDQTELDYQVSICSLIPPATAISKTQDRADMSVWWKLPFSIFFIIYYVQSPIIKKLCKPELWFLCSAHPIIVLYICMKFNENISNDF